MLHQELPPLESARLDRWERWLAPTLAVGAGITIAILLLLVARPWLAAAATLGGLVAAAFVAVRNPRRAPSVEQIVLGPDYSLVGAALGLSREPAALTTGEGSLLIVNAAYRERFGGGQPPLGLGSDDEARDGLEMARAMASRDGAGCVAGIATASGMSPVEGERVGAAGELLLWRFPAPASPDPLAAVVRRVEGATGSHLAAADVLAAVEQQECARPSCLFA